MSHFKKHEIKIVVLFCREQDSSIHGAPLVTIAQQLIVSSILSFISKGVRDFGIWLLKSKRDRIQESHRCCPEMGSCLTIQSQTARAMDVSQVQATLKGPWLHCVSTRPRLPKQRAVSLWAVTGAMASSSPKGHLPPLRKQKPLLLFSSLWQQRETGPVGWDRLGFCLATQSS